MMRFLCLMTYSRFLVHRSEAEVWPGPHEEQVGIQWGVLVVCWVDRHVGQTGILEQMEAFFLWVCLRQRVQ